MRHYSSLAFGCLLTGAFVVRAVPEQSRDDSALQSQGKIRVQSILVNEPVTVRDSKGQMVHNLEARDFRIMDNGVEQKITHFDLGGDAISLVVLVETSSRIDSVLPDLRKSGILLSQAVIGPNAEAAVVGFNDSVDKLQEFTTSADAIEKTMARLQDGTSGSRLCDAMALGVEMLSGRPKPTAIQPGRRRVMLVLAEADDRGSEAKLGAVLREAQLQNVTVWSVGLSTVHATLLNRAKMKPTDPGSGDNNLIPVAVWAVTNIRDEISGNSLQIAAAATGGTHIAIWKDRSIQSAIDAIGGELHSQYLLMYTPTGTDAEGYHEIKVEVDNVNLKVRSRPGYYREGPEN
ncbi:MAG: VWA domain-containing protein [Candidatus Acidiferrum sp.]